MSDSDSEQDTRQDALNLVSEVMNERMDVYDADKHFRAAEVLALVYVGDQIGDLAKAVLAGKKTVVRNDL